MAEGRLIGDAYVAILPNTDLFRAKADTDIRRQLGTLHPDVAIGANTSAATAQIAKLAALIKSQKFGDISLGLNTRNALMDIEELKDSFDELRARVEDIPVSTDDSKALASIFNISGQATALAKQLEDFDMDADISPMLSKFYSLEAQAKGLQAQLSHLDPNLDSDAAIEHLATLRADADQLRAMLREIPVDAADTPMLTKVAQIQSSVSTLAMELHSMPIDANTLPIEAKLLAIRTQVEALDRVAAGGTVTDPLASTSLASAITAFSGMEDRITEINRYLQETGTIGSASYRALAAAISDADTEISRLSHEGISPENVQQVKALDTALKTLAADTGLTAAAADNSTRYFGLWGRAIALLQTKIPLFGGALSALHFPDWIAQASGIHIMTEAVIEFVAIWGPATLALAAFGGLAYTTAKSIYGQFVSMNQVASATGAKFKGLKGTLQDLESAVQPQVMQLFGDYLLLAGNNAGHFAGVMKSVGNVLDDFGAKIVQVLNSQTTSKFLDKAAGDINGLGVAFAQVGRIIGTLIQAVPGYAELLLKFGDAFLTVVADATAGLEPVIALFLKVHGAIFYLGLATTAVLAFGRAFAAAAIARTVGNSADALTGFSAAAANWARDFTSDNEQVAAAAGASGSKLQGLGLALGGIAGRFAAAGRAAVAYIASIVSAGSFTGAASAALVPFQAAITSIGIKLGLATAPAVAFDGSMSGLIASSEAAAAATRQIDAALEGLVLAEQQGIASSIELDAALASLVAAEERATAGATEMDVAMDANPYGAIALAVVGVATVIGVGLYAAFHQGTSAAQQFNAQMQKLIANSNIATVQQNITSAISQTTQAISKQQAVLQAAEQAAPSQQGGVVSRYIGTNGQVQQAAANLNVLHAGLTGIITTADTTGIRLGSLTQQFGNASSAAEIMNLAGVNQSAIAKDNAKQWATDQEKIEATAAAYGFMGQQAGAAGNQLDALNIQQGTNFKATQALVQAESAWISLITGGESAFTTYEQGFPTLTSAMGPASKSADTLSVKVGNLTEKFTAAGATMNGTSAASLATRQAFDQQIAAGTTLFGNLQTLTAASGNTATAQGELAKSGKDIIAQLLPFAAGSKEATSEVSALAQLMGGPATDSFSTLAKWVGNTKGAEADLNDEQAKLTISSANLTTAAKNLGNAITTDVTNMEASKIATANLSGAVDGLYTASTSAKGAVTQQAVSLAGEYVTSLKNAGLSTQQAEQYLNAYLKQLGYGPGAIAQIDSQLGDSIGQWNKYDDTVQHNTDAQKAFQKATQNNVAALTNLDGVLPGTITQLNGVWAALVKQDQAMVKSGNDATGAKAEFVNFANQGLGVTANAAQALWSKFGNQNLDTLASKAANTKQNFIQFAENGLHLTSATAQALWGEFALQNLDMLVTKGDSAKNAFIQLAKNGLDLSNTSANALWNTLKQQYLDTLANKAGETQSAFVKVAEQLGDTASQAQKLWQQLHEVAGNYVANVKVNVSGGGKVTVNGVISVSSGTFAPGVTSTSPAANATQAAQDQASNLTHLATGGKVPGWHNGGDNVIARMAGGGAVALQGGEAVVPKNLATHPSFTNFAKYHGIPGYASGGLLAGNVSGNADPGSVQGLLGKYAEPGFAAATTASVIGQFGTALQGALNNVNKAAVAAAQAAAAGGAFTGSVPGGAGNLLVIAKYLLANGFTAAAAAGIAATIDGESGGNPESVGDGGFGLIGWTGNTIGLPAGYHGPTGNMERDMAIQLQGVIGYINANGGRGALNAAGSAVLAGDVFSSRYERPLVSLSDTRPGLANSIYGELLASSPSKATISKALTAGMAQGGRVKGFSTGGTINEPVYGQGLYTGMPYSFAENGQPEFVSNAGQVAAQPGGMQTATNIGQQQMIQLLQMIVKQNQQMPQVIGTAMGTAGGNGVRHGYFGAQN